MLACRPTRHTSRDWSKCYSCGRTGHALIHLSKGNIKSFLGVIPHVNMSWIYLYMIKSFRVHCTKFAWPACGIFLGLQVKLLITSPPEGVARYCFHPVCLCVCLSVCVYVCPADILVFYFSAI